MFYERINLYNDGWKNSREQKEWRDIIEVMMARWCMYKQHPFLRIHSTFLKYSQRKINTPAIVLKWGEMMTNTNVRKKILSKSESLKEKGEREQERGKCKSYDHR